MSTQNIEILHKIVALQSCVIQGRSIKALLHQDKHFYREKSQADIIAVFVNENEKVSLEYVVEDHHAFKESTKQHIFSDKTLSWNDFRENCHAHFTPNGKYHHTKDIYELFGGLISHKKALNLSEELQIKDIITMPLHAFDNKEIIGTICFMFQKEISIEIGNLVDIKIIFETLLRPLYDKQYNIVYSKCVRVDEHFKLLTEQEKRIAKKVLEGKSYTEIAETLNISINTVKTHMKNIFLKYRVNSKMELSNKLTVHL